MWGSAMPVDQGKHVVEVSAAGKKPWSGEVSVGADADSKTVAVPVLENEPQVATALVAAPPQAPVEANPSPPDDGGPAPEQDQGARNRRIIGLVTAGVGVVSLGVGTYFGVRALSLKSESDDHCDASGCDPTGLSKYDDAKSAALIANIAVGAGIVATGVGAYLVFTNGGLRFGGPPKNDHAHIPIRVTPVMGSGVAGLRVGGSW
jgi:serine/threonine-protein kinase